MASLVFCSGNWRLIYIVQGPLLRVAPENETRTSSSMTPSAMKRSDRSISYDSIENIALPR